MGQYCGAAAAGWPARARKPSGAMLEREVRKRLRGCHDGDAGDAQRYSRRQSRKAEKRGVLLERCERQTGDNQRRQNIAERDRHKKRNGEEQRKQACNGTRAPPEARVALAIWRLPTARDRYAPSEHELGRTFGYESGA